MTGALSAGLVALALLANGSPSVPRTQTGSLDATIAATFEAAYNLDRALALERARRAVAMAPDESRAHRALAAVLWIDIIFRRGAVTVDHYLGGIGASARTLPKPPPALDAEFKQELARAIELAERRLELDRDDVQARFDLGSAHALRASYFASVEGSMTSALSSARRAFNEQEDVLARDPRRLGAGVVVGTYRYMVAGMALPSRMIAYMVGFGGGKERGISLVDAATRDPSARVEAKTALVLIYSREGRHADAFRLLGELAAEFPRNRMFQLEQGSAAIRARKHAEADALLTRGLAALDGDPRPRIPGELALWLYKRGVARFGQDRRADATGDLQAALRSDPVDWVRGRVLLTLGKIADLEGRRDDAVAAYRDARGIAGRAKDTPALAEATRLLRQPFTARSRR